MRCARAAAPPPRSAPRKGWGSAYAKIKWNKWKNHFFKMKGDVGMTQIMKKNTNKKMLQPKTKILHLSLTHNLDCDLL